MATGVDEAVPGRTVEAVDRRGKVLLVRTDGPLVAVHFGMTGRLLRSGTAAAIDRLAYGAGSDHERWDRWVVALDDGSRAARCTTRVGSGGCGWSRCSPGWGPTRSR